MLSLGIRNISNEFQDSSTNKGVVGQLMDRFKSQLDQRKQSLAPPMITGFHRNESKEVALEFRKRNMSVFDDPISRNFPE
jgi:hypothetical protein